MELKTVAKISTFGLYFLLLSLVIGMLFFEKQFDAAFWSIFGSVKDEEQGIVIGYSDPLVSLSPLANDSSSKPRLLHIYEPLVRLTKDLQIEAALAISYGVLNDTTWEFRLRPDVKFHNGKNLTVDDVIFSLNEAAQNSKSGVKDLVSTIKEVVKIDESIFHIITTSADPLLLQKLSMMMVFPKQNEESKIIGTGPYKFIKYEADSLQLERFSDYWGIKPTFAKVVLKTVLSKQEKISALQNESVDILANLPADLATEFAFKGFDLKSLPSLEVNFLMFNFDGIFKARELREAVKLALRTDQLARLAQGFSSPTDQFVGNGIFGYDPSIPKREFDADLAKKKVAEFVAASGQSTVKVTLDLPKGLEVFGNHIKTQMNQIGIDLQLNFLTPAELGKKIVGKQSEFFFFGWKNDLGDASDFLTAVVHSSTGNFGQFNGANYKNTEVDELIEKSQKTLKSGERLDELRKVMSTITVKDIIGVPLFSPEVLYAVSGDLRWQPRVDGYVLAQEVKL